MATLPASCLAVKSCLWKQDDENYKNHNDTIIPETAEKRAYDIKKTRWMCARDGHIY